MSDSWREDLRNRIIALQDAQGRDLVERLKSENALPFAATGYWLDAAGEDYRTCARDARGIPTNPLLAQALPSPAEFSRTADETEDPLGESLHRTSPRIVHQYPSRLLIRATGECPLFCRHCFRRSLLPKERGFLSPGEIGELREYLIRHAEIREVLVSGGDPLTASTATLENLFSIIRQARPGVRIRLCTRAPVTLPSRVDEELLDMLERYDPIQVVIHTNHPAEITPLFKEKIALIQRRGIPVRSQTVLLRGVNDSVEILRDLFTGLVGLGIGPYYLFQGDLASGTSHFRVPLSRGLRIYESLRTMLSGLELPRYAVDAPDGGGKLYLPECVMGMENGYWVLRGTDGSRHLYPEESELGIRPGELHSHSMVAGGLEETS